MDNELNFIDKIKEIKKKLNHQDYAEFINKALEKSTDAVVFFRYYCWGVGVIAITTFVMCFQSYVSLPFFLVYIITNIVTLYLGIKYKKCSAELYRYIDTVLDDNRK